MEEDRPLGARDVAAVVVGAIVGVGIFFTPASLARSVPSPAWALGIWLLGGLASVAGALVFADLGAKWPRAGGLYVFLREGFGGRTGSAVSFVYGWLQLLVVQPGALAVIAVVLVDHLIVLGVPLAGATKTIVGCLAIATFTAANLIGLKTSGRVQRVMSVAKIAILLALIALGITKGKAFELHTEIATGGDWSSWILLGLIPILFTFGGAYHGTFIGGSVRDPKRALPRGIISGIAIVLVAYLGVNAAYFALLGHKGLAGTTSPAADAVGVALGGAASKVVAAAIVVSAAGILNTVCLGFPFVVCAMSKDGVFFARAGQLNPKTGRPSVAVACQGGLGIVALLVGASRIDVLLTGIAFADAIFQAAVAVVHLRTRSSWLAPRWAAVAFILVELGVALGCLVRAPRESAYGVATLVVGLVVWQRWSSAKSGG